MVFWSHDHRVPWDLEKGAFGDEELTTESGDFSPTHQLFTTKVFLHLNFHKAANLAGFWKQVDTRTRTYLEPLFQFVTSSRFISGNTVVDQ